MGRVIVRLVHAFCLGRWSDQFLQSHNKAGVCEPTKEFQKDSLDTLESNEIDLMFQRQNGNNDFVDTYRGRRVCLSNKSMFSKG
jgi:hypothetical protein